MLRLHMNTKLVFSAVPTLLIKKSVFFFRIQAHFTQLLCHHTCCLLFTTSAGYVVSQNATPPMPPAMMRAAGPGTTDKQTNNKLVPKRKPTGTKITSFFALFTNRPMTTSTKEVKFILPGEKKMTEKQSTPRKPSGECLLTSKTQTSNLIDQYRLINRPTNLMLSDFRR